MRPLHVLMLGVLTLALVAVASSPPQPTSDAELARRLLLAHGHLAHPKIVTRNEFDGIEVVTGSGKHVFWRQPPCDESLLCALGLGAFCWTESAGYSRSARM